LPLVISPANEVALREVTQDLQAMARASRNNLANIAAVTSRGLTLESGRAFVLLATKGRAALAKPGEIEEDSAARKSIRYATWYIRSHTPEAALPMTLNRAQASQAVTAAGEDGLVAVVAQAHPEIEVPGSADLYAIGTGAIVRQLSQPGSDSVMVILEGLERIAIVDVIQTRPYLPVEEFLHGYLLLSEKRTYHLTGYRFLLLLCF
jgi:hypothetical protein